jgi:hypothetical protein
MIRVVLLSAALLPFVWFARKDNMYHFELRAVSRVEHLLHLALGLLLMVAIGGGIVDKTDYFVGGFALFGVFGAIDEYWFHRDIPIEEHSVHAKEHLGLLIFVLAVLGVDWLEMAGLLS